MAYLKNLYEEDPNLQQQKTSGETTNFAGGTTGTPAAAPTANAPGSGWTNLQQYLDVNKGQVSGLADQVTGDINGKVDSFNKTSSADAVADINKQAGDDAAKSIQSNIVQNAGQAKDFLGQQVNVNQDNYTAGVRTTGAGLKDTLGQVDKQDYQQGNIQKLNNQKGNYSSGFGALDSFLLFGDQGAKDKLGQVKGRTGEVDSKIGSFTGDISGAVTSAKDKLAKNQGAVRQAAKDKYGNIISTASGRVDGAKSAAKTAAETKAAEIFNKKKGEYAGFVNDDDNAQGNTFIKNNDKFGVNNVVDDNEVAALNSLAGIDGGLGLKTITKDNSKAVNFDEGGWEALLKGTVSTRQADKAIRDKAAADALEAARVKKEAEDAAAKERARVGGAFSQAYSMPEGYNPNPAPQNQPPPSQSNQIPEKMGAVGNKAGAIGGDVSDASKQVVAAPGGAWDALVAPLQPAAKKVEKKGNATINNAKKGKVKL